MVTARFYFSFRCGTIVGCHSARPKADDEGGRAGKRRDFCVAAGTRSSQKPERCFERLAERRSGQQIISGTGFHLVPASIRALELGFSGEGVMIGIDNSLICIDMKLVGYQYKLLFDREVLHGFRQIDDVGRIAGNNKRQNIGCGSLHNKMFVQLIII